MNDPFVFLGIGHDADERTIKRAYAMRLRNARPDSDPIGFQTLNEAYRVALDWARERDADIEVRDTPTSATALVDEPQAIDTSTESMSTREPTRIGSGLAQPALDEKHGAPPVDSTDLPCETPSGTQLSTRPRDDVHEAVHEPLDFEAFFDALCEQAVPGDAEALNNWLQRQPALWSLSTKAQAGFATMTAIGRQAPPMPDRCFDVVLAFFDMDHVLAGQDALRLGRLRRRLHMEWLLLHERRELERELAVSRPPVTLATERIFRVLSGPFRWSDVLLQGLLPHRPSEIATFLLHLQAARVERLPHGFDRRRIGFWMRAGDRSSMSLPRLAIGFARCLVILLLALAVDEMLSIIANMPVIRLTALALIAFAMWLLLVAWLSTSEWQNQPQEKLAASAASWRRLLFIPALALAACAAWHLLPTTNDAGPETTSLIVSGALVAFAILFAIARYRRRANSGPIRWDAHFGGWRILLIMPALKALIAAGAFVVYYIEVGAALAIAIWLADLWKQRARLRGIS